MHLPNANQARVDRAKIVDYLLNASHPDGASKARFFGQCGFSVQAWQALAGALREHAIDGELVGTTQSPFGMRYTVEGPLATPDGGRPSVVSVWIIDKGGAVPRLVTAYPARRGPP